MDDLRREHILSDGRRVVFVVDDYSESVSIFDLHQKRIGEIEFDESLLVHAEVDAAYQRCGVAIAALSFLVECVPGDYLGWPPDGLRYEDARHLSIEGAAFVNRAVELKLMKWADPSGGRDRQVWDEIDS
jgi:hypothetical protein